MSISINDFSDVMSRTIFSYREAAYRSGEYRDLLKLVCLLHKDICERYEKETSSLEELKNLKQHFVIFGAGKQGKKLYRFLTENGVGGVIGFCDNDEEKKGKDYKGIPIETPENYRNLNDAVFLIPTGGWSRGMKHQLLKLGISQERIQMVSLSYISAMPDAYNINLNELFFDKESMFFVYGDEPPEQIICKLINDSGIKCTHIHNFDELKIIIPGIEEQDTYIICMNAETESNLLSLRFPQKGIVRLIETMDEYQYFDDTILKSHSKGDPEVFIDGGSCDLNTSLSFLDWVDNDVERIIAFECDRNGITECKHKMSTDVRLVSCVTLIEKGLWSEDTKQFFYEDECTSSSRIIEEGTDKTSIETTSIDNVLQGDKVTFIKMDIEGAELEALKGAKESIKKWHPILAISVYHKLEDIVTIPEYIKEIAPDYRLYLRNYHEDGTETVLYAI